MLHITDTCVKTHINICQTRACRQVARYRKRISLWEISLKYSIGKLELSGTNPDEIFESILESGLEVMPVETELFASYYKLQKKNRHKDPFDRLLIWQAIQNDLTVITDDSRMEDYVADGLKIKLGR